MSTVDPASNRSSIPAGPVLGTAIAGGVILLLGTLVPPGESSQGPTIFRILLVDGWPAIAWLLAALGLGSGILRLLPRSESNLPTDACSRLRTAWPLGIGLLLIIDATLGDLGLMGQNLGLVAWTVVLVPGIPGLVVLLHSLRATRSSSRPLMPGLAMAVPIAVLLSAAASTPGWLWSSEFGGYDALSYHLQLPREWWYAGGIVDTPHNAYGGLPGAVSAAFLHLMTLTGDPESAGVSSQLLVAGMTIIAAIATGDLATAILGEDSRAARSIGMIALLATPWVVVTGSLAYDESAVMLLSAAATTWLIRASIRSSSIPDPATGILVGLLLGAAVMSKASSGILVVIPLAVAAAILIPPRRWPTIVVTTMVIGTVACLPWLLRNLAWTGNPVFPFATGLFGQGDWTDEQVRRFAAGHRSDPSIASNLAAILREFLFDDLIGELPAGEPSRPQWLWLPIVGFGCLGWLLVDRKHRRRVVIAMATALVTILAAWAFGTHGKARFLLPAAPLLAAGVGAAMASSTSFKTGRIVIGVLAWCATIGPLAIYVSERDGQPAWAIDAREAFDGRLEAAMIQAADPATAAELRRNASRAFILGELPPDSRVVMLGVADPWHLRWPEDEKGRLEYTTVWTRGPVERAWESLPEGTAPRAAAKAAIQTLREKGTTHLLVSPTMLEVWSRSGWLDPTYTPDRIQAFADLEGTRIVHRFPDDGILLAIEDSPTP
ncbi:MAG: hypothetical protein CMJ67_08580 [Planctomycetaceae bacterium]|nr:hypothetical protein [Planctomycetaceae bacterium]